MEDPLRMAFDGFGLPAREVVIVREVLLEHSSAESWLVPGNVVPLVPGHGWKGSVDDVVEVGPHDIPDMNEGPFFRAGTCTTLTFLKAVLREAR